MSATKRALEEGYPEVATHPAAPPPAAASDLDRLLSQPIKFSTDERRIIRDTCMGGATTAEQEELFAISEARGLNPLLGECYFVKRYDTAKKREVWAVQISIDAMRMKADETGLYLGQDEPEFEFDERSGLPTVARVRVYRRGWPRPVVGVAWYDEYVQVTREGTPTRFWKRMPRNQLAKCAEALALRKAFPARFARIYTDAEMDQAQNPEHLEQRDPKPGGGHKAAVKAAPAASPERAQLTAQLRALMVDATTLAELRAVWDQVVVADLCSVLHSQKEERKREIVARQKNEPSPARARVEPPENAGDAWEPPAEATS